jgi:3-(3-hydroxy-phenyl)propionate hydroxylase
MPSRNECIVVDVLVARGRVDRRRGNDWSVAMTNHAVVIVGGGPTGLMLAGELALAGVDVAIVERRPRQPPSWCGSMIVTAP